MTIKEFASRFPGIYFPESSLSKEVAGVFSDSRRVIPQSIFIAVKGVSSNGNEFAKAAICAGAELVMGEGDAPANIQRDRWVSVPDSRAAVAVAACAMNNDPSHSIDVYGVTGTNGKTTTATVLSSILKHAGIKCGLMSTVKRDLGNIEIPSEHTTSDASVFQSDLAHMVEAGCNAASVEISSHSLDQKRIDGTRFKAVAFTNLTRDHLDYHKTMEKYAAAKWRLFEMVSNYNEGFAVLNADDECGREFAKRLIDCGVMTYTYSVGGKGIIRAENTAYSVDGTEFTFESPFGSMQMKSCLLGKHNVSNLLAAATMAAGSGIPLSKIAEAISECKPVRGRLERVIPPGYSPAVFVDYAHTPDALERVLKTLRGITKGKLVVVFGCGGDRDRGKRPQMGEISGKCADLVVVTSDNPRSENPASIIGEIMKGVMASGNNKILKNIDRRSAIKTALALVSDRSDTILIAGKGHETSQVFSDKIIRFDDREEVLSAFEK